MGEHLGGIQGDYGFESRAFHHLLSAPHFAAKNVPIKCFGSRRSWVQIPLACTVGGR